MKRDLVNIFIIGVIAFILIFYFIVKTEVFERGNNLAGEVPIFPEVNQITTSSILEVYQKEPTATLPIENNQNNFSDQLSFQKEVLVMINENEINPKSIELTEGEKISLIFRNLSEQEIKILTPESKVINLKPGEEKNLFWEFSKEEVFEVYDLSNKKIGAFSLIFKEFFSQ